MSALPLLIVEDDRDLRDALCITLELAGHSVLPAADGTQALTLLRERRFGLVISDIQMQPMDGLSLMREMSRLHPQVPVVLMTAFGDIESAVAAMRAGASNYLPKPFEPASLLQVVQQYSLEAPQGEEGGAIAVDTKSLALLALAERVAASTTTVLLSGESGCGKEVLARHIHRHSPRAQAAFVPVNCAAIPDNLIEATLFGHERGAYTGATQAQAGKFEQAQGGTLLLDEISEIPLALQPKLLRVLQEREVERVGAKKAVALDIRVIATTNRDLAACVAAGTFRADLYYRLNVFPLQLPALRERKADIVPLARRFVLRQAQALARPQLRLTRAAEEQLLAGSWPGNVRELENAIQRAAILAAGDRIEAADLDGGMPMPAAPVQAQALPLQQAESAVAGAHIDMKSLERAHILETLLAVNGSRKLAVERLGISERALRYKLQQYRIEGGAV